MTVSRRLPRIIRAEDRIISSFGRALGALKSFLGGLSKKAAPRRSRAGAEPPVAAGTAPRVVIRAAAERAAAQLPPPAAVTPRLVPAPPEDFTGRTAELAELVGKVEAGATILSLQGMGGVGKTALALKLAEALGPKFPDAQLWVDLRGSNPVAASDSAEALERLLRPFYPDSILPSDGAELAALLQKTLAGKRVLIVADDARGAEQVAPLVPPAGGLLVVTSREAIKVPGAQAKYMTPLRPDDAGALLAKLAPKLGEHAAEAAKACGCLPFVLRFAGWQKTSKRKFLKLNLKALKPKKLP